MAVADLPALRPGPVSLRTDICRIRTPLLVHGTQFLLLLLLLLLVLGVMPEVTVNDSRGIVTQYSIITNPINCYSSIITDFLHFLTIHVSQVRKGFKRLKAYVHILLFMRINKSFAEGVCLDHTCYPTQVNAPRLQTSRLVFNLPNSEGWKAEMTWWLAMYRDDSPVRRQSLMQAVTVPDQCVTAEPSRRRPT